MTALNCYVIYSILLSLLVCLIIYIIYVIFIISDDKLVYIVNKFVVLLPFDEQAKKNIYKSIVDFLIMLKNIRFCEPHPSVNASKKMIDIVGMPINNPVMDWADEIKYCDNKNGYIEDIYYDETVRPTKSVFTLY